MQANDIDYSALTEPLTREDVQAYIDVYSFPDKLPARKVFGATAVIIVVIVLLFFVSGGLTTETMITAGIAVLAVCALAIAVVLKDDRPKLVTKRAKFFKFAQTNNATALFYPEPNEYPGTLFQQGIVRMIPEAIRFMDGVEIGNYTHEIEMTRYSSSTKWGYVRIPMTRRLPHMLLDAKSNDMFSIISNIPGGFTKDQVLKLSSNFNEYFTLYAPKEYERDALYIFTPDVMAALIDFVSKFDVEIVDTDLILYTPGHHPMGDATYLRELWQVIDTIRGEVSHQGKRYSDARIDDKTVNVVDKPGKRLKRKLPMFAVIYVIIVAVCSVWFVVEMINIHM